MPPASAPDAAPRRAPEGSLVLVGVNHTTAPIEVRERLAIPAARLADAIRTLTQQPGIREALILSTCNRVEFLTFQSQPDPAAQQSAAPNLLRFLHEYFAIPAATVEPHLYEFREREAIRHLFRVASSLDSMVVGEPQILGQVKQSYTVAREAGAVATALEPLFQRAFSVAKRVRSETQIGSSSVSIASVAVDLARKIFGCLQGKTVLLVGAGKMSELAARHLIQQGATSILVANRTAERAALIAGQIAELISTQIANDPPARLHHRSHPLRPAPRPGRPRRHRHHLHRLRTPHLRPRPRPRLPRAPPPPPHVLHRHRRPPRRRPRA